MARTPLAQQLRRLCSVVTEAERRRVEPAQVVAERRDPALSRREFLGRAGKAGLFALAGSGFFGRLASAAGDASGARIAIVGGGLAGISCAYWLKQMGLTATVYEGAGRTGGRCRTQRRAFAEGQIAERGGELIDTGHTTLRRLAQRLGLPLDNLIAGEQSGTEPFQYFDGAPYSFADATADFRQIVPALKSDVRAAGYPTLYHRSTPRGAELDRTSITAYLDAIVPGGAASRLGKLLKVAYTIEYGAETEDQSALNLLYLLGFSSRTEFEIFGESDEKFHLRGGNDQLVRGMSADLGGQIETGMELTAIARTAAGSYVLTFEADGAGARTVQADQVVLALPFSILRASVDYSGAGFSALKQTAIQELGMGTNTKLQLQFNQRVWRALGCNGETYADTGYQNTWEATRAQPGAAGIMVDYTGGVIGASFNQGTPEEYARQFLAQIEPVLPGLSAQWNGRVILDYWTGNPFTRGAYSYWKVGQYTRFAGYERVREGNCHFAGEHTSVNFQGFLNGALQSGQRAAREVYADLAGVAAVAV